MAPLSGKAKFENVGKTLKAGLEEEKALALKQNTLAMTGAGEEVRKFFAQNKDVGMEHVSGDSIPMLKVTEALSKNELEDGTRAVAGQLYYSPDKVAYNSLHASILTISRGFYAMDNGQVPKPKYTVLLGGMILSTLKPFVMFVSGTRLQNMWDFGKVIKPLTKQAGIPMFALEVELSTEMVENAAGQESHVVKYELSRNAEGQIIVITDTELLAMLRDGIDKIDEMFANFIERKEVDRYSGNLVNAPRPAKVIDNDPSVEVFPSDDLPFGNN